MEKTGTKLYTPTDFKDPEKAEIGMPYSDYFEKLLLPTPPATNDFRSYIICDKKETTFDIVPESKEDRDAISSDWGQYLSEFTDSYEILLTMSDEAADTFTNVLIKYNLDIEGYIESFISAQISNNAEQGLETLAAVLHINELDGDEILPTHAHIIVAKPIYTTGKSSQAQGNTAFQKSLFDFLETGNDETITDSATETETTDEPQVDESAPALRGSALPPSPNPEITDSLDQDSPDSTEPIDPDPVSVTVSSPETQTGDDDIAQIKKQLAEAQLTINEQMQELANMDALKQELDAAKQGIVTLAEARTAEATEHYRTQIRHINETIATATEQAAQTSDIIEKTSQTIDRLNSTIDACYDVVTDAQRLTARMAPFRKPVLGHNPLKYYLWQLPIYNIRMAAREQWARLFVWIVLLTFLILSISLNVALHKQIDHMYELNQVYKISDSKLRTLKEMGKMDNALMDNLMRVDLYYSDPVYFQSGVLDNSVKTNNREAEQ